MITFWGLRGSSHFQVWCWLMSSPSGQRKGRVELEDLGLESRVGTGRGLGEHRERVCEHQQDPFSECKLSSFLRASCNLMKHSEEVIHIALSHPFQPTLTFFLLRSLGLEQLTKAKRKYQKAISVLFAMIDEISQMNWGKPKMKKQNKMEKQQQQSL